MLILLVVLAQAPTVPLPPPNVKISFEQVKPGPGPTLDLGYPVPDKPIFRVRIRERAPVEEPLWKDTSGTPAWVRPKTPPVHHEFLAMVTPESHPFRSGVLYPCCIDVAPLLDYLQDEMRRAIRSHREAQARRTVINELLKAGFTVVPKKN